MSLNEIEDMIDSFTPMKYNQTYQHRLLSFLEKCLPESGRALDIQGHHSFYLDIENSFQGFWCMFDGENIIGTVAVRKMDNENCELKSLYLLEQYHGRGYGRKLLQKAIDFAKDQGYQKMYLDTLSTSKKAIVLYRKMGFVDTEKYFQSVRSDVFMVLDLKDADYHSDITKEQLASYPIMVREYDPNWVVIYEAEKERLWHTAGDSIEEIFHFGSTSIPGMLSKPTVDILVILKKNVDLDAFCKCMTSADYICTKYPDKTKKRKNCMNFVVPYIVDGVNQYKCYIHIRENEVPRPELLFAQYLREHPEAAKEYRELKQKLAVCYENDRQEYMVAKTEFVEKYTRLAEKENR